MLGGVGGWWRGGHYGRWRSESRRSWNGVLEVGGWWEGVDEMAELWRSEVVMGWMTSAGEGDRHPEGGVLGRGLNSKHVSFCLLG